MDGALLGASLSLVLPQAAVIAIATNELDAQEQAPATPRLAHARNRSGYHRANEPYSVQRNFNMTYVSVGDLDPGGEGGGQRFNAVETAVWLPECESNVSAMWKLTSPVCSTKFTSFVLFVAVTVVLTVITLWTILGNVLVLWALYRYRYLRTMSNCLIGNLAVSDLLLAVTVLPISVTNDLLGYWVFGRTMCTVWLSIDVLYCTASIWGLCTIAFDRYTATVYPMWYHDKRSTRKALAYMLFVWVFSIVISLAPFIGWQDMISGFFIYDPSINRHMCILFSSQSYVIYSAMGSFILPSCFMTFLYVQIFAVLHKQSYNLKKKSSFASDSPTRLANGCPTIAISGIQETSCAVTRDFTASTFMAEETFTEREEDGEEEEEGAGGEEEEEEEEEEEAEDYADTAPPARAEFQLDDSGVDGEDSNTSTSSSSRRRRDEASTGLLRDQRSNSLNVEMETFRRDSSRFLSHQPKQDFLTVSTCDIPFRFKLKKSRSAAFDLQENGSDRARGGSSPLLSLTVPRSKSATTLCTAGPRRPLVNGSTRASSPSLQRFSLPWQSKRSNHMTTSMRRRFQLREQRATKRMLLIMACFFVCWVPFTLMYMLRSLCQHCSHLDEHVTAFIIWLGYINSSLNPLLYTLFNDDFRKAFKKLLRLHRPRRPSRAE